MHRRELIAGLGRSAAAIALGALFASRAGSDSHPARTDRIPPGDQPFTLGVASGMPGPSSVVLWTRLAPRPREPLGGLPDAPVPVRWELAEDELFSAGLRSATVLAHPEHAHSVHVEVQGLPAGRVFYYRFIAGDVVSPIGRTRTAPPVDAPVERLRMALASCQHYEQGEFALQREIAARDLDLVLFVGDYIYESSNPRYRLRSHEGAPPLTLEDYRQRHATYKLDPSLRAAHAAHPWVVTWDDHEVENDYAGPYSRDEAFDSAAFLQRRAAAYKAYFEHMPVSPTQAPQSSAMRIHGHHPWGQLADLWTLDNRQYRSLQACNPPGQAGGRLLMGCDRLDDAAATMFGSDQERWIADALGASRRNWRLLAQGTQIAPGGVESPLGRTIYTDGWDGYPQARKRLMQAIAANPLGNAVCLGGDVHRHVAARLRTDPADPRSPVVASEFVCSSLTSRGASEAASALVLRSNPDLLHVRGDERGYMLIDLTPQRMEVEMRATAFPVRSVHAPIRTQARYVVEAGRAGPHRDA